MGMEREIMGKFEKVSDLLECAADTIETRGLAKGVYLNHNTGACCTIGAIRYCMYGNPERTQSFGLDHVMEQQATEMLVNIIAKGRFVENQYGTITRWNDNKNQRKGKVVAALRRAANLSRGAGN